MNELVKIDHEKYGLEETRATEIAKAFQPNLLEMIELESEWEKFKNLVGKPPKETCESAKALKKKYVSIRTSTANIHKEEKAVYLNAGRFVDAWKNRQLEISKEREEKLSEIADYYVNQEKERMAKLRESRTNELLKYLDPALIPQNLGVMEDDIYNNYLTGVIAQFDARIEAERKAEAERIAKEKAERVEQERIRKENERLQAEAKKREAQAEKERIENAAKLKAQEEKAAAERAKAEALTKGSDKEKLTAYFNQINTMSFPSVVSNEAKIIADAYESFLQDVFDDISKL